MIHTTPRLPLLLLASLLAIGCGTSADDDDTGFSTSPDDDDTTSDDDDTGLSDLNRSAYVEFNRLTQFEEDEATTELFSSWFNVTDFLVRIPLPAKIDSCHSGQDPAGTYTGGDLGDYILGAPLTQHDIGVPSVTTPDGRVIELSLGENYWVATTESNDWESHSDYDVAISGGNNRDAASYPGALATPSVLTLLSLDQDKDGLRLEWYGGNNNGHVELRMVHTTEDTTQLDIWVVCRFFDDGEATAAWADLALLGGLEVRLELMRSATANFETDQGAPGVASGISSTVSTITLPTAR
jgi:hypothetical protein